MEVHDDHFALDAPDEVWLQGVGQRGWVVLTKDKNIRYRGRELAALKVHGVRAFILTAVGLNGDEMAQAFVAALPRIRRLLAEHEGAFIATISRKGAVHMVVSSKS